MLLVCKYVATASIACPVGQYSRNIAASSCVACVAGKYGTEAGAISESACINCIAGKYSMAGASNCPMPAQWAIILGGLGWTHVFFWPAFNHRMRGKLLHQHKFADVFTYGRRHSITVQVVFLVILEVCMCVAGYTMLNTDRRGLGNTKHKFC